MKSELVNTCEKKETLQTAVEKLDGKDIVELLEVAMGTALFGLVVVCLTGSEINLGNGKCVVSGRKMFATN